MISVAFINDEYEPLLASDSFLSLEKFMEETETEINLAVSCYLNMHDQYMIESEIMGELDEEKSIYLEAEKENIFDKIGNAIIELFKKFKEIVSRILDKIKVMSKSLKSDEEKMNEILEYNKKHNPEKYKTLKDEVIVAFSKGDLSPVDGKALAELDKLYDEFIKLSEQKDVKPGTLKAKLAEFKKKVDKLDESKSVKVSSAAKTVISAAVAIVGLKKLIPETERVIMDYKEKRAAHQEKAIRNFQRLKSDPEHYSENMTKVQLIRQLDAMEQRAYDKLISAEEGKLERYHSGILRFIDRWYHAKDKRDQYVQGLERGARELDRERQAERRRNRQDAADKAYGQKDGEHDYYGKHRHRVTAKIADENRAKLQADDELTNTDLGRQNAIRRKAALQEQGRAPVGRGNQQNNDDNED